MAPNKIKQTTVLSARMERAVRAENALVNIVRHFVVRERYVIDVDVIHDDSACNNIYIM